MHEFNAEFVINAKEQRKRPDFSYLIEMTLEQCGSAMNVAN